MNSKFYAIVGGTKVESTSHEILVEANNYGKEDGKTMVGRLMDIADRVVMEIGEEGAEWFIFRLGGMDFGWNPDDGWEPDPIEQLCLMVRGYRRSDEEFAKQSESLETVAKAMDMLADLIYSAAVGLETDDHEDRTRVIQEFLNVAYPFLEKLGVMERCKERFEQRSKEVAGGKPE